MQADGTKFLLLAKSEAGLGRVWFMGNFGRKNLK
nr:MAG TPA: hypothetical protein [Caudoviricetes sp.]